MHTMSVTQGALKLWPQNVSCRALQNNTRLTNGTNHGFQPGEGEVLSDTTE